MKATRMVLAILATAPLTAMAGVTITPMIGYQSFDNIMKNDVQPQIAAGYRFNNGLAVEGVFNKGIAGLVDSAGNRFTNQDSKKNDGTADYKQYRVDGLYYLPTNGSRFEPYVAAGIGEIVIEGTPRQGADKSGKGAYIQPNVGGGIQYALNDFLKLRLDGRYLNWSMGTGKSGGTNNVDDYQAALGLQLALGGAAAPVPAVVMEEQPTQVVEQVAAPLDSDADGVIDANDQCANTPTNLVVDATGCPKVIEDAIKLELRVFFDTNKSDIKSAFKPEIAKAAAALKSLPNTTATLEGHTDSRGSTQLNDRLSLARANSVKNALVSDYGIAATRLTAKGYGESMPVASNDTDEGRAMNRRVYAVIEGNKTVEVTK